MIEVTFDYDNDNIEIREDNRLKFEQSLNIHSWYPSEYQKFLSEILNLIYINGIENIERISIRKQSDGERKTVEEW